MHYPHLFSPIKIGNLTLKNRIAVAPMGSEPNTSGFLSEQNLAAYELRAKGGAAIVTRGETLIGHKTDSAHGNLCNLADERYMPSHLQLTDVIHQHNALALALAMLGKDVTILETKDQIASDAPILHLKAMLLEFAKFPETLQTLTSCTCTKITNDGIYARDKEQNEFFMPADTIILAVGQEVPHAAVEQLRAAKVADFIVIGDSLKPGKVLEAVYGGYFAGKNLSLHSSEIFGA